MSIGIPHTNPLDYTGPKQNIVPIRFFPREPTTTDKKYRVGQLVILGKNPSSGSEGDVWYLSKFDSNGNAIWLQIATAASSPGIDTITTDDGAPAVDPDSAGNVSILGGDGINVTGQGPGSTVTVAVDTSVVTTSYDADSGSATPSSGVLILEGGNNLTTSATGSTVTFSVDGNIADTYTANAGTATPSAGNINLLGGTGCSTSASGATVTVNADATVPLSFPTDSGTATPAANALAVRGQSGILTTSGSGSTLTVNVKDFVQASSNNWTPVIQGSTSPGAGTYTRQHGVYMRLGLLVIATFDLVWTAHTGTGDMEVAGFPVTFGQASSEYVGTILYENLTLPASTIQVILNGRNSTTEAQVTSLLDGAGRSQVAMDSAASLSGTIIYFAAV